MQEAPWPDVHYCPECAVAYSDDLGTDITEIREAEVRLMSEFPPGKQPAKQVTSSSNFESDDQKITNQ